MLNLFWYIGFNNYYNRKLRYYDDINKYPSAAYIQSEVINFNFGDGITTTHVVTGPIAVESYDYLVITNEDNSINSRWFVIEADYKRKGQYVITLKRDSIADALPNIVRSTVYCRKGTVNVNNPLIYNREEGWNCNQIKRGEVQIRDNTRCPWIVGYVAKKYETKSINVQIDVNYDVAISDTYDNWIQTQTIGKQVGALKSYKVQTEVALTGGVAYSKRYVTELTDNGISTTNYDIGQISSSLNSPVPGPTNDAFNILVDIDSTIKSNLKSYGLNYMTDVKYAELLSYAGKILRFNTDVSGVYDYKRISIDFLPDEAQNYQSVTAGTLYDALTAKVKTIPTINGNPNLSTFKVNCTTNVIFMSVDTVEGTQIIVDMTPKQSTLAAGYDIFCMPYGDITILNTGSTDGTVHNNKYTNIGIMTQIATALGSALYDLQLLPYCPIPQLERSLDISNNPIYTKAGNVYIFWASEVNVNYDVYVSSLTNTDNIPFTVTDPKTQNNCDIYRLVSPNYSGQFEFSVAKNGGVKYFSVSMSMKPYNPFIRVAPNFKELYGREFRDARGLICGGDFSLPIVTDQFKQYEINNKNYANIFDRQIQNLEVTQKIARAGDIVGAVAGTLSGAAGGAGAGAIFGPVGMGISAGIAGVASAAGGIADVVVGNMQRREQMNYTKDMYEFSLDNVKALPYSLSKVSSFNYVNKFFPFVEYYSCTDEERVIFKRKIIFEGMTIEAVGNIKDYWSEGNYFKGAIVIWDDDFIGDYHFALDVSNELEKGIRLYAELPE